MYEYNAKITRVVDGDTFDFEIDLGFGITYRDRLRLYGVDTPEVRGKEKERGEAVSQYVNTLIGNKQVILRSHKRKGKYGRFIANVFFTTISSKGYINLSDHLVKQGMAKRVDY